ncbi:MAG TPA: hypothetical protein VN702_11105 [Acetobacteraceae bacterium]|nr:hypothetical protein [Acetobacteraceae bacterium]
MSVRHIARKAESSFADLPEGRPLCIGDVAMMAAAIADVAPDWSVELQGICADEASLIMLPETADDAIGPSFVVQKAACGFRLDQFHWDAYSEIGAFSTMDEVVHAVRAKLELIAATRPISLLRH